jgi:hypothetical protein
MGNSSGTQVHNYQQERQRRHAVGSTENIFHILRVHIL